MYVLLCQHSVLKSLGVWQKCQELKAAVEQRQATNSVPGVVGVVVLAPWGPQARHMLRFQCGKTKKPHHPRSHHHKWMLEGSVSHPQDSKPWVCDWVSLK